MYVYIAGLDIRVHINGEIRMKAVTWTGFGPSFTTTLAPLGTQFAIESMRL